MELRWWYKVDVRVRASFLVCSPPLKPGSDTFDEKVGLRGRNENIHKLRAGGLSQYEHEAVR